MINFYRRERVIICYLRGLSARERSTCVCSGASPSWFYDLKSPVSFAGEEWRRDGICRRTRTSMSHALAHCSRGYTRSRERSISLRRIFFCEILLAGRNDERWLLQLWKSLRVATRRKPDKSAPGHPQVSIMRTTDFAKGAVGKFFSSNFSNAARK